MADSQSASKREKEGEFDFRARRFLWFLSIKDIPIKENCVIQQTENAFLHNCETNSVFFLFKWFETQTEQLSRTSDTLSCSAVDISLGEDSKYLITDIIR